jgi:hypothetical protein
MTEPQINAAPEAANTVSIADMSLAEYRAHREAPAAAPEAKETAPSSDGSTEPEESAAPDNAEDTPEHEEGDGKPEEKSAAKKKGGWQRKIDKAEREIEALKAQLAGKPAVDAPKAPETNAPKADATPAFAKPEPQLADFDSVPAYTKAMLEWDRARIAAEAEQQKILSDWNSRQAEAQKAHEDYQDVLQSASDVMLTPAHQRLFLESEAGAELAYQLAKDPKELQKFAALDPLKAARYFGKLEAALDAPKPETRTVSNAPKPIKPVGARAHTNAAPPDLSRLSIAEYRRMRESGRIR